MLNTSHHRLFTAALITATACFQLFAATVARGPYLQMGTPTGIVVRWRTDIATDSKVQYGAVPGSLTLSASNAAAVTEHSIALSGLSADTTYYYSIGTSTTALAGDASYFFVTSPAPGNSKPTRIWVLGDPGSAGPAGANPAPQQAVRDAYYAFTGLRHTDLWLMLGDNVYDNGTDAEYQRGLFDIYPAMLRKSALWLCVGNHDTAQYTMQPPPAAYVSTYGTSTYPYFDAFTLPTNGEAGGIGSATEQYFSFDYGNIHFISLDSQTSSRAVGGPMATWLTADLASTNKAWIIAFWHHPPYSKGNHDSDTDTQSTEMRQNIVPILENGGVDLVLSGHSHDYERSYLINGHYGTSDTFNSGAMRVEGGDGRPDGTGAYDKLDAGPSPHEGAVYTVAGSSGKLGNAPIAIPAMFIGLQKYGSMVLDINAGRLDAKFLDNTTGVVLDYFTILKGAHDTQPPTVPANLALVTRTGSSISLTWDASTDAGTGVAAYKIFRNGVLAGTAVGAAFTDSGLSPGTAYTYTVKAQDVSGNQSADSGSLPVSTTASPGFQTLVPVGADWKFLDNGSNQGTAWIAPGFDDSLWSHGPAKLGYGDADVVTPVSFGPDMNNKYITTYFRKSFTITDASIFGALTLSLMRDDGAVIYLNGSEIFRSNMPGGTVSFTTLASTVVGGADETTFFPGSAPASALVNGTNVLAVEIHQANVTSSDIGFNFSLTGATSAAQVRVETAADGSGSVVSAQNLSSGSMLTVYAIARDADNGFIGNVAALWSLAGIGGGVMKSDLAPSADGKRAIFTARATGGAAISAASDNLDQTDSGLITVIPGPASQLRVETDPDGDSGPLGARTLVSGASLLAVAVTRDAAGNFIANAAASWSLFNPAGGVASGDLQASADGLSATFTARLVGITQIQAATAELTSAPTGVITVHAGAPTEIRVETAVDGSGSVVAIQPLTSGSVLTVFAIARDAAGNFTANTAATWSLIGKTGGVADTDLVHSFDSKSAVFTARATGTAQIQSASGALTPVPSGTITVQAGAATQVRVETAADGNGGIVASQPLTSGSVLTVFAVARDTAGNFTANIAATWSLIGKTGGAADTDLVQSPGGKSAVFTASATGTAKIQADSGVLSPVPSGTITVQAGAAMQIRVETVADGSGSVVTSQSLTSGSVLTVFAIARDALNNFAGNTAASWSLLARTGGVVDGDLVASADEKSAIFTGRLTGSAQIHVASGTLTPCDSGTITVLAGAATQIQVETAADGSGSVVTSQSLTSGSVLTVFAIARDASSNFVGSVAASWSLLTKSGGVEDGDLIPSADFMSAVFTGHLTGTARIEADSFVPVSGALAPVASGLITVVAGSPTIVLVETEADGSGTFVMDRFLASGASMTFFAISRDAEHNFVANVSASWSLAEIIGLIADGDLVAAGDGKNAVFTGKRVGTAQIRAASGALTRIDFGTITVEAGAATEARVETNADGYGTVVPAQALDTGASITVFPIASDAAGNLYTHFAAAWSLLDKTGLVADGDLVVGDGGRNAVFTAHGGGTAQIHVELPGEMALSIDSGVIRANSAPALNSKTGLPNPAGANQSITFTAAAADADAVNTLAYTWDFHDGTPATSGASVAHAFSAAGSHSVTVTVSDGHGGSASADVTVTVNNALLVTGNIDDDGSDADGDGFSNKFEIATGTNASDSGSTPYGNNGPATPPVAMTGATALSIKLNFIKVLSDRIQLKGMLPLTAADLPLTGHKVVVNVGGFIAAYTLNAKGKSPMSRTSSFTLSPKPGKTAGFSKFSMKISKSNVASFFADEGMIATANANTPANVLVTILFHNAARQVVANLLFTQTKGTTGKTKPAP